MAVVMVAACAGFGLVAQVGFGFNVLLEYACWGVALLVQSLAESRLLIEYGWLLMVMLAVKMKKRETT